MKANQYNDIYKSIICVNVIYVYVYGVCGCWSCVAGAGAGMCAMY